MFNRLIEMWRMRTQREDLYAKPNFWNKKADTYSGTAVSMFINRTLNDYYQAEQFSFFDSQLGDISGHHVFDVGCGTGRLSRHLALRGATVSALDFAEKAIEIARRESAGMTIEYKTGSVFEINDDAAYDDITVLGCLTVACRTPRDFEDVVGRLFAAVKPGGKLIMVEPFHTGFLHRVLKLSGRDAASVLEDAGFVVETRQQLHFWPVRLLLTLGETPKWITRALYPMGETLLRLSPNAFGMGDYTAIAARRPA